MHAPTTLRICSDLHLDHAPMVMPACTGHDIVVLAGDVASDGVSAIHWASHPDVFGRAKAIIYVPGNHEYYGAVMPEPLARMRQAARGTNVQVLDCDQTVVDGIRFLGCTLWTDFGLRIGDGTAMHADREESMAAARSRVMDYRHIRIADDVDGRQSARGLTPQDTLAMHRAQAVWLEAALARPFDGPTVVVTHMAPHRGSLNPAYAGDWTSGAFVSELPDRLFQVPVLWVHGHTHTSFDYRVGACRVLCNPRGYLLRREQKPENELFDPTLSIMLA